MANYGEIDDDDEFAKLIRKMNPPRVVIDNDACDNATVIRVDCVNKHGILLEVIQVLTDINLSISKAYISSDGSWFMNVFNVTDRDGNKIWDAEVLSYIQTSIEKDSCFFPSARMNSVDLMPSENHTYIELIGMDRPGLLSEVCAVLTDLSCNIIKAQVWTHNARAAAVVHVTDWLTGTAIEDPMKLATMKVLLYSVLKGDGDCTSAKSAVSVGTTHTERRLHQLMFNDRDYEKVRVGVDNRSRPQVTVMDCFEKDYTVVILRSKDRPKLFFDTMCTLTDMQYVVFHGTVNTGKAEAYQEYYVRHVDGLPVSSEAERERVIQCLEAAIERRASEGLELELRAEDKFGLLAETTRILRENGLSILRADISTSDGKAVNTFYVLEMSGEPVEAGTIESIRRQIGQNLLQVKYNSSTNSKPQSRSGGFLFGSLFKGCSFQSFRLVRSYT